MKKFAGFAAVLVVLASMGVFATDSSACCRQNCTVVCDDYFSVTDALWGVEATCDQAHASAVRAVENQAYQRCSYYGGFVCEFGYVDVVTPCMDKDGMKRVDVTIEYKCGYEVCTGPDEPQPI